MEDATLDIETSRKTETDEASPETQKKAAKKEPPPREAHRNRPPFYSSAQYSQVDLSSGMQSNPLSHILDLVVNNRIASRGPLLIMVATHGLSSKSQWVYCRK